MHDIQVAVRMSRSVVPPLVLAVARAFTFSGQPSCVTQALQSWQGGYSMHRED